MHFSIGLPSVCGLSTSELPWSRELEIVLYPEIDAKTDSLVKSSSFCLL